MRTFFICAIVVISGCIKAQSVNCGDAVVCPAGTRCVQIATGQLCALPSQQDACNNLEQLAACEFDGLYGYCQSGYCIEGYCGDGMVDPSRGEDCEPTQLAATCLDFSFYEPAGLACSDACRYDTSACTSYCGDRVLDSVEECEGRAPEGATCTTLGFESGSLGCFGACVVDTSECNVVGWNLMGSPTNSALNDVWTQGPAFAIAVGNMGTIAHWDGVSWTTRASGTTENLHGVWGVSPSFAFAVGTAGTMLRWDGATWMAISSGTTRSLRAVAGTGTSDAFAVGAQGTIVRWNGSTWTSMTPPPGQDLLGVWVMSTSSAYAVGDLGTILRWNGSSWSQMASPYTQRLRAVWGVRDIELRENVWAVGDAGEALFCFDCAQQFPNWVQPRTNTSSALFAVTGSGPNDVLAVGEHGTVLRWDGGEWSPEPAPIAGRILGADAIGSGSAMIVGEGGRISRWNGTRWRLTNSSTFLALNAVWGADADNVFAVGIVDTVLHWRGVGWKQEPKGTAAALHGVWGTAANNVFAVGADGVIVRWQGSTWSAMSSNTSTPLRAVWVTGPGAGTGFAVGDSGTATRWNGTTWTSSSIGTEHLRSVWGSGANNVYAVGDAATLLRWDGSTWSAVSTGLTFPQDQIFADVWGSSADDVFVIGSYGAVLHWDGTRWTRQDSGFLGNLISVSGTGPNDVFIASGVGVLLVWDGYAWSRMRPPALTDWKSIWAGDEVFAVANSGTIAHRPRACFDRELRCRDDEDEDCDGLSDCSDPDCAADVRCAAGGRCAGATPIACGDTIAETTVNDSNRISRYACSSVSETGPERSFQIVANGSVTVRLTAEADLDLVVLSQAAGGGCDPAGSHCIGASSTTGQEVVTFAAKASETYFLVVDGYGDASGAFELSVSCP